MLSKLLINAKNLGVALTKKQAQSLIKYLDVLYHWNKTHNLCAKASKEHMLAYHVLDSLSVAANIDLSHKTLLDIGAGAGLPAIPLAIARPQCFVTALDATHKKTVFMQYVVNQLGLTNIKIINARAEKWDGTQKFDVIVSRAVGSVEKMVLLSERFLKKDSIIVLMKAGLEQFDAFGYQQTIKQVTIPGISSARSLVFMQRLR